MFIWCVTLATCRFKLPAGPPGSPVQHVTDVTGVQSAGAGPQTAGQLIRQLSAARHFQCHGHQAECAGMAVGYQGVLLALISWSSYTGNIIC